MIRATSFHQVIAFSSLLAVSLAADPACAKDQRVDLGRKGSPVAQLSVPDTWDTTVDGGDVICQHPGAEIELRFEGEIPKEAYQHVNKELAKGFMLNSYISSGRILDEGTVFQGETGKVFTGFGSDQDTGRLMGYLLFYFLGSDAKGHLFIIYYSVFDTDGENPAKPQRTEAGRELDRVLKSFKLVK